MEYLNPKYEQKIIKKWRTNSVSTKFVHFWVVSVSKYLTVLIFCVIFLRIFNIDFFGRTKFTRSSFDYPVPIESRIQTHHFQIHFQRNIIHQMTPIQVNQIKRYAIRRKIIEKTRNRTCQSHHLVKIMIRPTTVITDTNDVRVRAIVKRIRSNYAHV